ncbi:two-component regulator propeller domain-containing protein [Marinilabilia sp.]|uniref:hybrid sensor histidine kinase/response regulator transcription factor n=1 Tax=Marinilabilia sp. TaxID=2021252 RepID=UPI0025B7E09A|nr:two-component regulator propeller domain-containing protein [Marinilabilia sp.]
MWIRLFLVFFGIYISAGVSGQKLYDFDALTIEDGFTSSRANVFMQDSHGYIWIGNWNGLNRYDGYEVKVYKPRFHDSTTISNREVVSLLESRNGNIWIGTSDGLNCLNPRNDQIRTFEFHNRILALHEDTEGHIWIGTIGDGLYRLNPETGFQEHFFAVGGIRDIYEDRHQNLWLASNFGLISFDPETGSYQRYVPGEDPTDGPANSTINQIVKGKGDDLWVGTWGGGLSRVTLHDNRDSIKFVNYKINNSSISSDVVFRLFYDDFQNLWIGTWNEGLCLLPPEEQEKSASEASFQVFKSNISNPYSISDNNITALFVDRSGLLWVGSTKIDRTCVVAKGMNRYNTCLITNGTVTRNTVRSFAGEKNDLWVGTYRKLSLYNRDGTQLKESQKLMPIAYKYKGIDFRSYSVLALEKTKNGLWIGTDEAGLLFFRGARAYDFVGDFQFFNTETELSLPGNKVNSIVQSSVNPQWVYVGTQQSGFAKLTMSPDYEVIETKKFVADNGAAALSDNNIRALLEDSAGRLWIGTQNGLNCYYPETDEIVSYFYDNSDETTINDNVINVLFEDGKNNLWVGTNSGLNKIIANHSAGEKFSFKGFPSQDRIGNELVTNILADKKENLWVGFYRGMVVFDTETEQVDSVLLLSEYQRTIVEINSAYSASDGSFFLGGGNGIFAFHPDRLKIGSAPPVVEITDFLVFNERVNASAGTDGNQDLRLDSALHISYKDDVCTFVFSAMDFKSPLKNTYSYMLEGFDKDWNQVGNRNTATYTNLPSGEYTFKVRAANSDGIRSRKATTIGLLVSTPWWKSSFAYAGYGLVLFGLLYFFKAYSIVEAKEKGEMLIEKVRYEKENELNVMKSQFFTNITHEFRTPLTLILGPAQELSNRHDLQGTVKNQITLIQRNAQRLLRLVNQLMEFSKIERETIDLILDECNVNKILNELYDSFSGLAASRSFDFKVQQPEEEIIANLDKDKFERIFFNLVSNAFKYSDDGGSVIVKTRIGETSKLTKDLIVEVIDEGYGISSENQEKVFDRFYQVHDNPTQSTGGVGLYLTRIFVEQHGGYIELESEPEKGSCFRVVIPFQEAIPKQQNIQGKELKSPDSMVVPPLKTDKPLVLVVEDDSELCDFLIGGLSADFEVKVAHNGLKGLEKIHEVFPDIIVSDIMMPGMDGFEMTKKLRKDVSISHIPVVFLTAKTMREDEISGLKLGAVDYIYKPFDMVALKLKIRNILETRRQMQESLRKTQLLQPKQIKLPSLDEKFLTTATKAVNKHLDNSSLDVDLLSREVGMSANQTYRKIKALTGQTAKEFIRNQRLKVAADLLLQKKKTISEIIYMVGFSSPSYFTRCFKDYFGSTPSDYIQICEKKELED